MQHYSREKIRSGTPKILSAFLVLVIAMAAIGYLGGFFARASSFEMATGSYTGNGTSQSISSPGFQPDLVLIKADTNVGPTVFTTSAMVADLTLSLNFTPSAMTGAITSLDAGGFSVGSHVNVNSNTITYRWVAFGGSGGSNFKVGSYIGDGNDNRSIAGVGFQPDLVWIKRDGVHAPWRSLSMTGDPCYYFGSGGTLSDTIQALEVDGFQVGTDSKANDWSGSTHYYVAFKVTAGSMAVGTYTGNGNDGDTTLVSGLGFQPEFAWVQRSATSGPVHRSASISGDSSQSFIAAANTANLIQDFASSGLELGNDAAVNANGGTYYYTAFGSGVVAPVLDSLNPTSGREGDSITLSGSNFGATQGSSTVSFNGTAVTTYTSWGDTEIVVKVPTGATTGNVTVTTDAGTSSGVSFSVYPKITSLSPSSGNIGDTVTITGLNFETPRGSNTVTFNGVGVSSYTSWSDTQIVVVAPSSTTGNVIVTTSVGASTGSTFSYYPAVSSISPTTGSSSTSVTITGSNFGAARGSSYVSFGSTQASVSNYLVWGNGSILVQVPSGATKGDLPVTVTTSVGTSNSQTFKLTAGTVIDGVTLVPSITSVSPAGLDISEVASTSFTITGKNFDKEHGVNVQFYLTGIGWLETKRESTTSTTLKVKFVDVTKAKVGSYYVVVTNTKGGNKASLEGAFTVSDKTAPVEVPKEGEKEVAAEPATTPSVVDSAAIALLTEQFGFLKKQYNQVVDLLKFFGRLFSSPSKSGVLESTYRYKIDFRSPNPFLAVGKTGSVTVSVKNTGTATWYKDGVYPINLGTSNPLDRQSVFATDSWFGNLNRPAVLQEESVAPGDLGTFVVPLKAPSIPGTYVEPFRLVAENFVWLSGPEISWTITVAR